MHANIEIALQQQQLIEAGAAAEAWERDELEAKAAPKRRPPPLQRRRGLTEQQVADQLGVSLWTVKRERKRGRLGHVRIGQRRVLILPEQLAAYLAATITEGLPCPNRPQSAPTPSPAIGSAPAANSPVWCATWFDPATRQTRRASLGETDFRAARLALAQFALARAEPRRARPEDTPLDEILLRYWEQARPPPAERRAGAARAALRGRSCCPRSRSPN